MSASSTTTKGCSSRSKPADEPLPVVGYVRVSTLEQSASGLGLAAQRSAIAAAAAQRDLTLGKIYSDSASGKSLAGRPGLDAALAEIAAGRAAGLIVSKLDRLSRSLHDFVAIMQRSQKEGWSLITLDIGLDTASPQGELMASVLASIANFERKLIGQRTRDALAEKRAKGARLGRPRETPDDVVDQILELRAAGLTFEQVADRLAELDVPTARGGRWTAQGVHRTLRSWRLDQERRESA